MNKLNNITFEDILSLISDLNDTKRLLRSCYLDEDTYLMIYKQFPKDIRQSFFNKYDDETSSSSEEYDVKEYGEEEYQKVLCFFKKLLDLKRIDLVKSGLKELYFGDEYSLMFYDLASAFFENGMLKEYYEMIVQYDTNIYEFDEGLVEPITNIILNIDVNKIYYLINETADFALKQKSYDLIKFTLDAWNSNNDKVNFDIKGMTTNDIEKTVKIIDSLNNFISLV